MERGVEEREILVKGLLREWCVNALSISCFKANQESTHTTLVYI